LAAGGRRGGQPRIARERGRNSIGNRGRVLSQCERLHRRLHAAAEYLVQPELGDLHVFLGRHSRRGEPSDVHDHPGWIVPRHLARPWLERGGIRHFLEDGSLADVQLQPGAGDRKFYKREAHVSKDLRGADERRQPIRPGVPP
jgi:hypothetical protein